MFQCKLCGGAKQGEHPAMRRDSSVFLRLDPSDRAKTGTSSANASLRPALTVRLRVVDVLPQQRRRVARRS